MIKNKYKKNKKKNNKVVINFILKKVKYKTWGRLYERRLT
jgi:hypothetical protein